MAEFDVVINGKEYAIQEGGYSISSINNPAGLRPSGGNTLREYSQWSEKEFSDFSNGIGRRNAEDGGMLMSGATTLYGGVRSLPILQSVNWVLSEDWDTTSPWGAHFAEVNGYLFMGIGHRLYHIRRDQTTGTPELVKRIRFRVPPQNTFHAAPVALNLGGYWYTPGSATPSPGVSADAWWGTVDTTNDPAWPFTNGRAATAGSAGGTIKNGWRITDMCSFDKWLVVIISDTAAWKSINLDKSLYRTIPRFDPQNPASPQSEVTGIYVLDMTDLFDQSFSDFDTADQGWYDIDTGCTGYFTSEVNSEYLAGSVGEQIESKIWLYPSTPKIKALGCKVIDGYLFVWTPNEVMYTAGDVIDYWKQDGIVTAGTIVPTPRDAPAWWNWVGVPWPNCTPYVEEPWRSRHGISSLDADDMAFDFEEFPERITSVVSLMGQSLSFPVVYVSTTRNIYSLLPGDIISHLAPHGTPSWWNGVGGEVIDNDAYFVSGNGLIRITINGQIVRIGIEDTVDVEPNGLYYRHAPNGVTGARGILCSLLDSPYMYTGISEGHLPVRMVGYKGQGWHAMSLHPNIFDENQEPFIDQLTEDPVQRENTGWNGQGAFYEGKTDTLWYVLAGFNPDYNGTTNTDENWEWTLYAVSTRRDMGINTRYDEGSFSTVFMDWGYKRYSYAILSPFDARMTQVNKDWERFLLHVRDLDYSSGARIRLEVAVVGGAGDITTGRNMAVYQTNSGYRGNGLTWIDLGWKNVNTNVDGVLAWDNTLTSYVRTVSPSKGIVVRITLDTSSNITRPLWVDAVSIEYFGYIRDYWRWTLGVTLPPNCLNDICGVPLVGYDQADWDDNLLFATCSESPIAFIDADEREYGVRIESATRRISGLAVNNGVREKTYDWSLVLTQCQPDSACDILST